MYYFAVFSLLIVIFAANLPTDEIEVLSQAPCLSSESALPECNNGDSSFLQWSLSLQRQPIDTVDPLQYNTSETALGKEQQSRKTSSITASKPRPTMSGPTNEYVDKIASTFAAGKVKTSRKQKTHLASLFPSSWLCLGPFNIREYGTDPLRAFGTIQDVASRVPSDLWDGFHNRSQIFDAAVRKRLAYDESLRQVSDASSLQLDLGQQHKFPNFPSETGPKGRTWWMLAYTSFSEENVPANFKLALNDSGMNMSELHYIDQTGIGAGWAIGEINLTTDTTILVRCSDYFYIDDSSLYMYDTYGEKRSVHVIHLAKGAHRMYVNFYTSYGFFCDVHEDSQEARTLVTGLPGSFNEIEVSDVSDGTNYFIPLIDVAVSFVVQGVLASSHLGVPVLNAATKTLFLGDAKVTDGPETLVVTTDDARPVMHGQNSILKLQIHHTSKLDCDNASRFEFVLALYPVGEDNESYSPTKLQISVPCREHGGAVAYPELDGSIQLLWAEPPNISRFANRSCPPTGCPMLLSLHGAAVDMWRGWGDTYAYAGPKANNDGFPYPAWLVQPSNRWRYGTDWEQQGFDNILAAVQYVEDFLPLAPGKTQDERKACCGLNSRLILITGHSMGGHGCEVYGMHFPDRLVGVACASAWGSIDSYFGGGDVPLLNNGTKRGLLEEVGSEHSGDFLSANLRGIPMHAFYGSADNTVPSTENKLTVQLVSSSSGDPFAVPQTELPGVGHWFEQDVPEMVRFFEKAFDPATIALPQFPIAFEFTVTSASTFGSRGHLKLVEKLLNSRPSSFFVQRCTGVYGNPSQSQICSEALKQIESDSRSGYIGGDPLWVVHTANVQHFILGLAEESVLRRAWPRALMLDGVLVKGLAYNRTYHLCYHGGWHLCSESETALPLPAGKIDMAIRRAPVCLIYGSGPGQETEAVRLAHKMYFISRYSVTIINAGRVASTNGRSCVVPYGCDQANLIFFGSPSDNVLTDCFKCAFPYVRFFDNPGANVSGFAVGGNAYVHRRSALLAVGIIPTSMRIALLVHGNGAEGLARAVDNVPIASQHDFADFMVFGPEFGWQGQGGLLATGFLDSRWRIATQESWLIPEHAVEAEFPLVDGPVGEDPTCTSSEFWQRIRSRALHGVIPGWVQFVCSTILLAFVGGFPGT